MWNISNISPFDLSSVDREGVELRKGAVLPLRLLVIYSENRLMCDSGPGKDLTGQIPDG